MELIHNHQTKNIFLKEKDDFEEFWINQKDFFIARGDELQEKGSGLVFQRVNSIRIHLNNYTPLSITSS
jgi:hypothetical protein